MIKYLFIIQDIGDSWKITGTRKETENFIVNPDLYYETASEDFFEFVKQLISGPNEAKYLKGINPTRSNDLLITGLNQLEVAKMRTKTKGEHFIKNYIDETSNFDFFHFQITNNKLILAGYTITNENRDNQETAILASGIQSVIDDLEIYLEVRDRLEIIHNHYDTFLLFQQEVKDATTIDEVNIIYNDFALLFQ